MKVTKPTKLGILHRTYSFREKNHWVVKPIIFFDLTKPENILNDVEGWKLSTSELMGYGVLDECLPKARPEVLLTGSAFSPMGKLVTEIDVRLQFGSVDKTLVVTGNRIWQKRWFNYRSSKTSPFSSLPITWDRSFGFPAFNKNPTGQGALSPGLAGETIVALPNIEYPESRFRKPKDIIKPAGYGPINQQWSPRNETDSLFNKEYIDETFPDLPSDLNFGRFNTAPLDQQMQSFNASGTFSITNLHPEYPVLVGNLPRYKPRAFFRKEEEFEEIEVAPETLWLFPRKNLGVIIFSGEQQVSQRYAQLEVNDLLLAYESSFDEPRRKGYYLEVLKNRTDPATSIRHCMDESQLSPKKSPNEVKLLKVQHEAAVANSNAKREEVWREKRQSIFDEQKLEIPSDTRPEPSDPRTIIAPEAIEKRDFSLAPILDYSEEKTSAAKEHAIQSKKELADLDEEPPISETEIIRKSVERAQDRNYAGSRLPLEEGVADEADQEELNRLELAGLASVIQAQPISYLKANKAGRALRDTLLQLLDSGQSLAYRDFTGADLSGLDLSNVDLEGCLLECASLQECSLRNANLTKASLVNANLIDSDFSNAILNGTNLSQVCADRAIFTRAEFAEVTLAQGASFNSCDFTEACLDNLNFKDSVFKNSLFERTKFSGLVFIGNNFEGCDFFFSEIKRSQFISCRLNHTLWTSTSATRTVFVNSWFHFALVEDGRFERCQITGKSFLTGTVFRKSNFSNCGFRNCQGTGVSFADSRIDESDLGMVKFIDADFRNGTLVNSIASDGDYSHSNFSDSILANNKFSGSQFDNAQLNNTDFYQSDVLLADFKGANVDQARNFMELKEKRISNAG